MRRTTKASTKMGLHFTERLLSESISWRLCALASLPRPLLEWLCERTILQSMAS